MELNARQLANQVGVSYTTLLYWVNNNLIHPVHRTGKRRTPMIFDRRGLREAKIITKLRRKATLQTLSKVAETLEEWGDNPFSIEDFLVIRETSNLSFVKIYEDFKQLEISRSGDITMILPLYPIEKEIDDVAEPFLTDLRIPSKDFVRLRKETLRSFSGRVERINQGIAYMTMIDDESRKSLVECLLKELQANGIENPYEGMMFKCNIERKSGETSISFKPVPDGNIVNQNDKT